MKTKRLASVVAMTVVLLSVSVLGTSVTIAAKQSSGGLVFAPSATPVPPPFPKPPAPGGIFSWFTPEVSWLTQEGTQIVKWFEAAEQWLVHEISLV